MKFAKIFKVFSKGAKAASKSKGKKGKVGGIEFPHGVRVGVFGHANSGKTVYYTVLNEECKIAKDLQISVTDNATAGEFLNNYRALWGLGTSGDSGTVVDYRGDKNFPDPTKVGRVLQFTAILNRSKKVPVVSYDYGGNAVSITKRDEQSETVMEFMSGCDGILFFFDPKILGAEIEVQSHVASFVNMLEQIAPLNARMPIPIALVINKADVLPGFSGESQTVLISPEEEKYLAEDFEIFLEKILNSNKISSNVQWAGSVRNVLVKLREFLRVVIGRTLNFHIFFTSNTGNPPTKIGADIGRSVYTPPQKIRPSGVKEPFYWLLSNIVRNRRISALRRVTKMVTILSIIWIILYSLPFVYHFHYLLKQPYRVEDNILKNHNNDIKGTTAKERNTIKNEYSEYKNKWLIKNIFPNFQTPAERIYSTYHNFDLGKSVGKLDNLIFDFAAIVKDSTRWPVRVANTDSLILRDFHNKLVADLTELHVGEEDSDLFLRSDRSLKYWDLFSQYIASKQDTAMVAAISEQIKFDAEYGQKLSPSEKTLRGELEKLAVAKKTIVAQKVVSQEGLTEYENIKERINNSAGNPTFLLGTAVDLLKDVKSKLSSSNSKEIEAINAYIKDAEKWDKKRTYTYKLVTIPDNGHLHIEVTPNGQNPSWNNPDQQIQSKEYSLEWKIGDDIHIAFDELKHLCQLGKAPSDTRVFQDKYSLFEIEGDITFTNIQKTIKISFSPGLKEGLPKLK
ncbi:MAG: GTPase domain-containing protein [Candidatus Zixiibacteriota bacterium]